MIHNSQFPTSASARAASARLAAAVAVAAAFLAVLPTGTDAQPLPDSVVAHDAVRAFVHQLSNRPPLSDDKFVTQWFDPQAFTFETPERIAATLRTARSSSGGVTLVRAEQRGASPWLLVEVNRTRQQRWIPLYVERQRLMEWNVRLDPFATSGAPPELPAQPVPMDSVVPIVRAWLAWWAQHDVWSGTVAMALRDSVLMVQGVGKANRAQNIAATADTRYHLGSANKMLTAVRILQLVRDGRLRLEDTVQQVLPMYPRPEVGSRITVRQLLTHTAGLGGLFEYPPYNVKNRYGSHLNLLEVLRERALLFAPGSQYRYSNEGFLVLGAIIEHLTGQRYEQTISENILRVADMQGWCDCAARFDVTQRADGYSYREDTDPLAVNGLADNRWFIGVEGLSLGGFYATATDMLRFGRALQRGQLLPDSLRALMWTAEPLARPAAYGLGMMLSPYEGRAAWGHGGGGGRSGIGVEFGALQDGTWSLAVMGNRDLDDARLVYRPLMRFLAQQTLAGR